MTTTTRTPAYADPGSHFHAYLLCTLVGVVIISGIGGSKGVSFGPVLTDGGFFLFPLAYIIGDVITEVYGIRAARRAIIVGTLVNILAAASYWLIIVLPGFDDEYGRAKQAAIETALGPVWIIVLAGMLGFIGGQSTNSALMWLGKRRHLERGLLARLASSTGAGELVDTVIFCSVASFAIGIHTWGDWLNYTFFGFLYKVLVQYACMPLTALLIRHLKRHEPSYQAALAAQPE